ncbi:hypothetical protein HEP87_34980 [Streptomyces sp. S1D4-11]|nr:hypothetical protein [Streptomyces sp. S1D4-11]QIY98220.1 hypothetical protein HEP87_34980 [Streptomyces sp. S1D4-11]
MGLDGEEPLDVVLLAAPQYADGATTVRCSSSVTAVLDALAVQYIRFVK